MFMYIIYNIYTYRFAERYRAHVCSRMLTYANIGSRSNIDVDGRRGGHHRGGIYIYAVLYNIRRGGS